MIPLSSNVLPSSVFFQALVSWRRPPSQQKLNPHLDNRLRLASHLCLVVLGNLQLPAGPLAAALVSGNPRHWAALCLELQPLHHQPLVHLQARGAPALEPLQPQAQALGNLHRRGPALALVHLQAVILPPLPVEGLGDLPGRQQQHLVLPLLATSGQCESRSPLHSRCNNA